MKMFIAYFSALHGLIKHVPPKDNTSLVMVCDVLNRKKSRTFCDHQILRR